MKGDIQILLHDRDIGWYTNNARKGYEKYHTVTVSRTISNKPTYTIYVPAILAMEAQRLIQTPFVLYYLSAVAAVLSTQELNGHPELMEPGIMKIM